MNLLMKISAKILSHQKIIDGIPGHLFLAYFGVCCLDLLELVNFCQQKQNNYDPKNNNSFCSRHFDFKLKINNLRRLSGFLH